MAGPYTLIQVTDVTIGGTDSLLANKQGRVLPEDSRVRIFANRESVDVSFGVTLGATEVLATGGAAAINATIGDVPSTRDDLLVDSFGFAGDEILILAANANAALQEARVIVWVDPIDDDIAKGMMDALGGR
jgi:hypothetical protein